MKLKNWPMKFSRSIKNILLIKIIVTFFICSCGKDEDNKLHTYINLHAFSNVSNRATAYPENEKIISLSGKNKIITYLDQSLGVHLVYIHNKNVLKDIIIDYVPTNHGGGSLVKINDNNICIVYGGHIEALKIKCYYIYNKDFYLEKDFSLAEIDNTYNRSCPYWQTYPYVEVTSENIISILYREELGSLRHPRLVYIEVDVEKEKLINKKIVFTTKDVYANFIGSFKKVGKKIYILFRYYGRKNWNEQPFNKGIYLSVLNIDGDSLKTLNLLKGYNNNLNGNFYISNIIYTNGYLYFLYTNYFLGKKGSKDIHICKICIKCINQISCKSLNISKFFDYNEYISTTLNISYNYISKDFFIVFNTKKEEQWSSITNKVYYISYKENKENEDKLNLLYSSYGWFPNIEKNVNLYWMPSFVYHNLIENKVYFAQMFQK